MHGKKSIMYIAILWKISRKIYSALATRSRNHCRVGCSLHVWLVLDLKRIVDTKPGDRNRCHPYAVQTDCEEHAWIESTLFLVFLHPLFVRVFARHRPCLDYSVSVEYSYIVFVLDLESWTRKRAPPLGSIATISFILTSSSYGRADWREPNSGTDVQCSEAVAR